MAKKPEPPQPISWNVIAGRFADGDCPWVFDHEGRCFVSASEVPMGNRALILSIADEDKLLLPEELAEFLDLVRLACDFKKIVAILDDPRFAILRDFDFRIEDLSVDIGVGRRAKNTVRHKLTNYDEMLEAGGGLLWPEVYEKVRRGVDLMVVGAIRGEAQ